MLAGSAPVWVDGRECEMNLMLGFRGSFTATPGQSYSLDLTASTIYRVWLNGEFLGYGPARAAHGFYRVDAYDLTSRVKEGENIVAVEVAGYNVNTYYLLDQPSFLQAELSSGGKILLATGTSKGFEAFRVEEKLQKVERYSFQRPFTEYYRLNPSFHDWTASASAPVDALPLRTYPRVQLLSRGVPMPDFTVTRPTRTDSRGEVTFVKREKYFRDRSLTNIGPKFKGYRPEELDVTPSQTMQELETAVTPDHTPAPFASQPAGLKIAPDYSYTFDMGFNNTGFIGATVSCTTPARLVFYFDEMLTNGRVDQKKRMADVNNQVIYELAPGRYTLESFEPYTFKYLQVIALDGEVTVDDLYLRDYVLPYNAKATFKSANPKLDQIFEAARTTFHQNAVDVLTDCPSRERAGWLCDGYFSAIMESELTGQMLVTRNFLQNYALPERFEHLPEGMIPMCYPADHNDSIFIPNWSLWFILEVQDYCWRTGDSALIAQLKPRITKLLDYFARFENEDGLLERLERWVFVEWSKAASFVQDVNYPSNMLYSMALRQAADLYNNDDYRLKSERVKAEVLRQSYNGTFFVDNAVREADGKLTVTDNTTEVCQYYAFYFDIATPQSHPDLWKALTTQFGPKRDTKKTYPDVFVANAFMGNYLRMDLLSRYGFEQQVLDEVQDFFHPMATQTGTLWEHMGSYASCNHGFASYIGHVLYRDVLGVRRIDYQNKEVTIRFSDLSLPRCSGTIPIGTDGLLSLSWQRNGNTITYTLTLPDGYRAHIENRTTCELKPGEGF